MIHWLLLGNTVFIKSRKKRAFFGKCIFLKYSDISNNFSEASIFGIQSSLETVNTNLKIKYMRTVIGN